MSTPSNPTPAALAAVQEMRRALDIALIYPVDQQRAARIIDRHMAEELAEAQASLEAMAGIVAGIGREHDRVAAALRACESERERLCERVQELESENARLQDEKTSITPLCGYCGRYHDINSVCPSSSG